MPLPLQAYRQLAQRLDALPNGFPSTPEGIELRLLAKLFTPEEAALAAQLRLTLETPVQLAARIGGEPGVLRKALKEMARRGLIAAGRAEGGLGYGLLPFVVGIYEMQAATIDAELAQLFEAYYRQAYQRAFAVQPPVHRIIPIKESVRNDMEIRPYESAADIVQAARAWGVLDCICRTQKALIGEGCHHPRDVCMVLSETPGAFDHSSLIRAQSQEQALETLQRAAGAGLVHNVSNSQDGLWYICNCCTCSCGVLRGIAELGIANVVARSAFVCRVDDDQCHACGLCLDACAFGALALVTALAVNPVRCVGCGLCVAPCPENALALVRRPGDEQPATPQNEAAWRAARAAARGQDLNEVL